MKNHLVGRGWAFPPRIDKHGRVALVADHDEIKQAIVIILSTAVGERVMRPTFGSRLHELVFAPLNAETMTLARLYVEDALAMWEPRIVVEEVQVLDPFPRDALYNKQEGVLQVGIRYKIKATGDQRSLVYPFYLIPGE